MEREREGERIRYRGRNIERCSVRWQGQTVLRAIEYEWL